MENILVSPDGKSVSVHFILCPMYPVIGQNGPTK